MVIPPSKLIKDTLVLDALRLIKGFRGGVVYGAKIRLPHALVMSFLFGEGPVGLRLINILKLTCQHSWNLGRFVATYKFFLIALKRLLGGGEAPWMHVLSGGIGGYLFFSNQNTVNNQVVLYLLSRVLTASLRLSSSSSSSSGAGKETQTTSPISFTLQAIIVWASVMYLHRYEPNTLQPSLESSMRYLYDDSENWTSWYDFFMSQT